MTYIPPNPNGHATMANSSPVVVASDQAPIPVSGSFWQATQPVSFTWAGLTDAQLRASAVSVSFTWAGLTDTQLRATPVPVSMASTTIAGTVAVAGPLTDTQLRASAVPVALASTTISGTVAVSGPLTDAQLRAAAVPMSAASLPLPAGAATEATLAARVPVNGQALMAASLPVAIASNQSAIPVSQSGTWNIGSITTLPALPAGSNTIGAVSVNKPALTGSSPATVAVGVTSGAALAANASRKGAYLKNTSTAGQRISLSFSGTAAVLDSGVTLDVGDSYFMGEYDFTTGAINAIASAASGRLSLQEWV